MFVRLEPEPLKVPPETVPVTERLVRVPTEVMFGCAASDTTWATVALWTVPVTLVPGTPVSPDPDPEKVPAETVPETARDVRVPTEVMFG